MSFARGRTINRFVVRRNSYYGMGLIDPQEQCQLDCYKSQYEKGVADGLDPDVARANYKACSDDCVKRYPTAPAPVPEALYEGPVEAPKDTTSKPAPAPKKPKAPRTPYAPYTPGESGSPGADFASMLNQNSTAIGIGVAALALGILLFRK